MMRNTLSRSLRMGAGSVVASGVGYVLLSERKFIQCQEQQVAAPQGFDIQKMLGNINMENMPDWLNAENMKPLGGGLSFGTATGFTAGMCCKKLGRVAAIGVGGLYILFQTAAHYKYITINWKKVEEDVTKVLDTNGDGKLDDKDAGIWLQKVLDVLATDELQGQAAKNGATGGFAAAFLIGLRKG